MSPRRVTSLVLLAILAIVAVNSMAVAERSFGRPGGKHKGTWLAGDFHVHSTYSHDSWSGPDDDNTSMDEAYTYGWSVGEQGDIARSRGLDFLTITDHNDVRSASDPAFDTPGLIWVPGYENSLAGHAQMIGVDHLFEGKPDTVAGIETLAAQVRDEGGIFQVNHPSDLEWEETFGHAFVPDTVEVWNIGPWIYQHPLPAANDNDYSLSFYDAFLDAGEKVGATGGSDNHWRTVTAVGGVGQPTTWVFAKKSTPEGILEGLREGRTTISHQPPGLDDAFLFMEGDDAGDKKDDFDAMIGDEVLPGSTLRVTAEGGAGAYLRLVTDGSETLAFERITSDDFTFTTKVPEDKTWVRAEMLFDDAQPQRGQLSVACDAINTVTGFFGADPTTFCTNRLFYLALTSPIYFRNPEIEPSPTPEVTP